jgi:hypothetical protein
MKRFTLSILAVVTIAASFAGCANTQSFIKTLGAPAQVQADVTALGAISKTRITDQNVLIQIHKFALDLQQAGNLDPSQLVALIPHTGNVEADALIAAGVSFVNSAIQKWGTNNGTTLSYVRAVATGLLNAGF